MTTTTDDVPAVSGLVAPTASAVTPPAEREKPWAWIATTLPDGCATAAEATAAAGMDFDVTVRPAGYLDSYGSWLPTPGRAAVVRADTGVFYEIVSVNYEPLKYATVFGFLDAIPGLIYVAAGAVGDGREGVIVTQIPGHALRAFTIGKRVDKHTFYLVVRYSQDATRALEAQVLPIRNRSGNTVALNPRWRAANRKWTINPAGDPADAARVTLANVAAYQAEYREIANSLAHLAVSTTDARNILEAVLPARPRRPRQIRAIIDAADDPETGGYCGTGWGLVNGVAEYMMWGRSEGLRTDKSRFTDVVSGTTFKTVNTTTRLLLAPPA